MFLLNHSNVGDGESRLISVALLLVKCQLIITIVSIATTTVVVVNGAPMEEHTLTTAAQERHIVWQHDAARLDVKTPTPIIGILTQVLRDYKRFTDKRHLHIAASYVKWIESAGAQVLPILLNQNDTYYERVFNQTNGLLLPGGDNLLDPRKDTPMMVAAKKLYKLAVDANDHGDYYPIWGTCLGLELLSVLTSNKNVLAECSANDVALTMDFTARGRLFAPSNYSGLPFGGSDYSKGIVDALTSRNLTYNFHHKCLTDEGLQKAGLVDFYKPLAYSNDKDDNRFIAIFEAFNYPFYGVQFHPEKAPFEFVVKKSQTKIPHSRESIAISRYFADFFVTAAQMNGHRSDSRSRIELGQALIYSYDPMYTALKRDMYEQRYLFPYQDNGLTTEEFLDYLPDDDEEAPEEVSVEQQEAPNKCIATNNECILDLREKFARSEIVDPEDYYNFTDLLLLSQANV